ncbi:hypothetical protein WJX72_004972 [[Myrmecia] bisecta]|uniref:Uncharacterized protein n=1 Tax=[Myrmecia] bisecta TaxID=41462 RepID=A0AAW1Q3W4_9CHLO
MSPVNLVPRLAALARTSTRFHLTDSCSGLVRRTSNSTSPLTRTAAAPPSGQGLHGVFAPRTWHRPLVPSRFLPTRTLVVKWERSYLSVDRAVLVKGDWRKHVLPAVTWAGSQPACTQQELQWLEDNDDQGEFLEMCTAVGKSPMFPNVATIELSCPYLLLDERYIQALVPNKHHIRVLDLTARAFVQTLRSSDGGHWQGFMELTTIRFKVIDGGTFRNTADTFLAGVPASLTHLSMESISVVKPCLDGRVLADATFSSGVHVTGFDIVNARSKLELGAWQLYSQYLV